MEKHYKPWKFTPYPQMVNLNEYFGNFCKEIRYKPSKVNLNMSEVDKEALAIFSSEGTGMSEQELAKLQELCSVDSLTSHDERVWELNKRKFPQFAAGLKTVKAIVMDKNAANRNDVKIDVPIPPINDPNPQESEPGPSWIIRTDSDRIASPYNEFIVTVRVYSPLKSRKIWDTVLEKSFPSIKLLQEFECLGSNTLENLKDAISCDGDQLGCVKLTEEFDKQTEEKRQSLYFLPGSVINIGNILYVDTRYCSSENHATVIQEWGKAQKLKDFVIQSMNETTFGDLNVRFGYPYLYQHQGNCEHIIVINDARVLGVRDSLICNHYPRVTAVGKTRYHGCMVCGTDTLAQYVVRECDALPNDPSFLCHSCFRSYFFIGDKPRKNIFFSAYLIYSRNYQDD